MCVCLLASVQDVQLSSRYSVEFKMFSSVQDVQFSSRCSVQFKMVSVHFEKPMRAPPRLSQTFQKLALASLSALTHRTIDPFKPFTHLIPTLDGRPEAILCGFQDVKIQLLNWKMRAFPLNCLRGRSSDAVAKQWIPMASFSCTRELS